MHPALTLAVYALAVARATRLVTSDRITEAPRRWLSIRLWARTVNVATARSWADMHLHRHDQGHESTAALAEVRRLVAAGRLDAGGDPPLGVYLLSCPWCASIWLGAAAAPLWYWLGSSPWLLVPAVALAFSYVTGFLASKEG
jgi:hypothetical protein